MTAPRLILFPGLGADGRMFVHLGDVGCALSTPALPIPLHAESMDLYARRIADTMHVDAGDYVGGCSFGALVASAIARQRPVAGLVLIAGAISSATVAGPAHWLTRIAAWSPDAMLRALLSSQTFLTRTFGPLTRPQMELARAMLAQTPRDMFITGARLATSYFPAGLPGCPVYALHGSQDRVMRPPAVPGCRLVSGAGHALPVTHPQETTQFVREILC